MADPDRLRTYYRAIDSIVRPALEERGFESRVPRSFHREIAMDGFSVLQIVEFQTGVRRLAGQFTVNLGVYSPEFFPADREDPGSAPSPGQCLAWRRLGFLADPPKGLLDRVLGRTPTRRDRWWRQSADRARMAETMQAVLGDIVEGGLPYLEQVSTREDLERQLREVEERLARRDGGDAV